MKFEKVDKYKPSRTRQNLYRVAASIWAKALITTTEGGTSIACPGMDTIGKPKDIHELQKHYQDLFTCYSALQRDHNRLIAKHKSSLQVIGKQKKEIQSLKLRYASPRLHRAGTRQTKAGGCQKVLDVNISDANIADSSANKENVENALGQLQTRLSSAEGELQALKSNPQNDDSKTEVSCQVLLRWLSFFLLTHLHRMLTSRLRRSMPPSSI